MFFHLHHLLSVYHFSGVNGQLDFIGMIKKSIQIKNSSL